jgi:23S rRNA pseudouridine1911/1915/1917 synthase
MSAGSDPGLLVTVVPKRLAGRRFDKALVELFEGMSGSELQRLVRRGQVKVEGKKVFRSNFNLRGGERITLRVAAPPKAPELPLRFLHEAEDFAVVSKPPGMLIHPNEKQASGTVADLAVARYGPLPSVPGEARPGIVHRLDRETSGVMVIARTAAGLKALRAQFMQRSVAKTYVALVHGVPSEDEFELDLALAPVPGQLDLQRVDSRGKSAHTAFRVERRFEHHALVECRPSTGRRHQLRVHLAHLGHSVVGDKLYRPAPGALKLEGSWHHMLHAARLEFDEPEGGTRAVHEAPRPASFEALLDVLLSRP